MTQKTCNFDMATHDEVQSMIGGCEVIPHPWRYANTENGADWGKTLVLESTPKSSLLFLLSFFSLLFDQSFACSGKAIEA
jgi:hypothetical protein